MKESAIERKVVEYCRNNSILCYKFTSPQRRGVPDRILLYKGRVMFLELKAPGKMPSPLQEREMVELRARGFLAVWSDDVESAKDAIAEWVAGV